MYCNFKMGKGALLGFSAVIIAACLTFMYSGFSPAVSTSAAENSVDLPVIMYHSLLKDSKLQGEFVVDPQKFESDLKSLKEKGYTTITANDLIDYVYNDKPLPQKPIMLTFDDGYYNNYLYAYPLLKKYDCKAVISPICYYSEWYSNDKDAPSPSYSHCTWEHLAEMQESGCFEIQNHSYNMHSQSGRMGISQKQGESDESYKKTITKDISTAQRLFKENLNCTPQAFVYPFGALSDRSENIIKGLSFKCSFTCEERMNSITKDKDSLYLLGRFIRTNKMTTNELFDKFE